MLAIKNRFEFVHNGDIPLKVIGAGLGLITVITAITYLAAIPCPPRNGCPLKYYGIIDPVTGKLTCKPCP
jgi:hypothetical protein